MLFLVDPNAHRLRIRSSDALERLDAR